MASSLASGEGLKRGSPVLALRNHLINKMLAGGKSNSAAIAEWVGNTAFNYLQGAELVQVKRGHNGLDYFRARQRGNVEKVREIAGAVSTGAAKQQKGQR